MQLPADTVSALMAAVDDQPTLQVTVDLAAREVRFGGVVAAFELDDFTRWRLMEGLDDIGLTLRHADEITEFEAARPAHLPSLS